MSERSDAEIPPGGDAWGVLSRFDAVRTVELAATLHPDAERIVALTGSSTFDVRWEETAREVLGSRYENLDVEYLSGLSLEGFKDAARGLSSDTILLVLTVLEDSEGRRFVSRDAVAEIVAVSGAPAYSVYSSYLGIGVVGGFIETFQWRRT